MSRQVNSDSWFFFGSKESAFIASTNLGIILTTNGRPVCFSKGRICEKGKNKYETAISVLELMIAFAMPFLGLAAYVSVKISTTAAVTVVSVYSTVIFFWIILERLGRPEPSQSQIKTTNISFANFLAKGFGLKVLFAGIATVRFISIGLVTLFVLGGLFVMGLGVEKPFIFVFQVFLASLFVYVLCLVVLIIVVSIHAKIFYKDKPDVLNKLCINV